MNKSNCHSLIQLVISISVYFISVRLYSVTLLLKFINLTQKIYILFWQKLELPWTPDSLGVWTDPRPSWSTPWFSKPTVSLKAVRSFLIFSSAAAQLKPSSLATSPQTFTLSLDGCSISPFTLVHNLGDLFSSALFHFHAAKTAFSHLGNTASALPRHLPKLLSVPSSPRDSTAAVAFFSLLPTKQNHQKTSACPDFNHLPLLTSSHCHSGSMKPPLAQSQTKVSLQPYQATNVCVILQASPENPSPKLPSPVKWLLSSLPAIHHSISVARLLCYPCPLCQLCFSVSLCILYIYFLKHLFYLF